MKDIRTDIDDADILFQKIYDYILLVITYCRVG